MLSALCSWSTWQNSNRALSCLVARFFIVLLLSVSIPLCLCVRSVRPCNNYSYYIFLPHIFTITSSAMSASSAVFEVFVCIGNRELIFNKNKRHTISLCVESRFSRNRHNPQAFRGHTPLIISTLRRNHVLTNTFLRCFRWKSGSKTADRSTRKWWRPPRDREPVVCHWVHRTPDRTVPTINQCIRVSHHNDWIIQTAYISQKDKYG